MGKGQWAKGKGHRGASAVRGFPPLRRLASSGIGHRAWEKSVLQFPISNAQFSIPNAQCSLPNAQCPMPNAQCPIP